MNNLTHEFPEFCIDLAKLALTISTFYQHFCNIQPRYPLHRKDLTPRSTPKNLARNEPPKIPPETLLKQESSASSAIPPELFAATIDFTKNSGIYERNRAHDRHVLRQRDRHKSDQVGTIDTRQDEAVAIGQEKTEYALSRRKYAVRTKHETLTGRSLRAFLPTIAVRTWGASANRCSLEKPSQTEARSTQLTNYQERNFWQWIEPPPDIPICILEGAAFLKKGGAAL